MQITRIEDIKHLGAILGIWAHPDDETYCMGGIMAIAAANGQRIACITATKGEAGIQDESRWPAEKLGDIRAAELDAALKILGVTEHYWLGCPDGCCDTVNQEEALEQIVRIIKDFQPDTILTFGPDGLTGHTDHQTVSAWASKARDIAGSQADVYHAITTPQQYEANLAAHQKYNIYFNIDQPAIEEPEQCDICLHLPEDIYEKKLAAFRAMPSQMEAMLQDFEADIRIAESTEAFVRS